MHAWRRTNGCMHVCMHVQTTSTPAANGAVTSTQPTSAHTSHASIAPRNDRLSRAEHDLASSAYDTDAWITLLDALPSAASASLHEHIHHVRIVMERFLAVFPTAAVYWKRWIEQGAWGMYVSICYAYHVMPYAVISYPMCACMMSSCRLLHRTLRPCLRSRGTTVQTVSAQGSRSRTVANLYTVYQSGETR